jgi:hypothetical protein
MPTDGTLVGSRDLQSKMLGMIFGNRGSQWIRAFADVSLADRVLSVVGMNESPTYLLRPATVLRVVKAVRHRTTREPHPTP